MTIISFIFHFTRDLVFMLEWSESVEGSLHQPNVFLRLDQRNLTDFKTENTPWRKLFTLNKEMPCSWDCCRCTHLSFYLGHRDRLSLERWDATRALLRSRGLKIKDIKVIQVIPVHNFAWLQVFMQKININATENNSVPLELGKQHHTREKKEWLDRPAKFQPKFGHFQDHGG